MRLPLTTIYRLLAFHIFIFSYITKRPIYKTLQGYKLVYPILLNILIASDRFVFKTVISTHLCICTLYLNFFVWFSPGTQLPSTNKTDCHDITEILLKVPLNVKHHKP